jgi:hypothetical protein
MARSFSRAALLLSLAGTAGLMAASPQRVLKVIAGPGYRSGVPVLVRVEVRNGDGRYATDLWDAEATLSTDRPAVTLTPAKVPLRNGMGSAFVTVGGSGDFQLTAALGELTAVRQLADRSGAVPTLASGDIAGPLTEWSGVVQVTATVNVPAGRTLRILPGTLVLVNGIVTGTTGPSITIKGTLQSMGTEEEPVAITASDPLKPWGQIRHDTAAPSSYQYTSVTRAGNSPPQGHTGTGPAIEPLSSKVVFRNCTIGWGLPDTHPNQKIMHASGSDLEFYDCLLTHSRMGPEIEGTSLVFQDSYSLDMIGTDDDDGIYLHDQKAGQVIAVRGSVFGFCDDDGIDTLGAVMTVDDTILRDMHGQADPDAKGISIYYGEVDIRRCQIVNDKVGVSAKGSNTVGCTVRIDDTTIIGDRAGIKSDDKYGQPLAKILYYVGSSIVKAPVAVETDYPPGDIHINYSDVSDFNVAFAGSHNTSADPMFLNEGSHDYHLQAGSPCVDSGDPAAAQDPDGTRADMGAFYFPHTAVPVFKRGLVNEDGVLDLSDPVALLFHLFAGRELSCLDSADVNDDGALDVSDALYLLDYLFKQGPPPAAPQSPCGVDPTPDSLGCTSTVCP